MGMPPCMGVGEVLITSSEYRLLSPLNSELKSTGNLLMTWFFRPSKVLKRSRVRLLCSGVANTYGHMQGEFPRELSFGG